MKPATVTATATATRSDGDAPGEYNAVGRRSRVHANSVAAAGPAAGPAARMTGRDALTLPEAELRERLNAILAEAKRLHYAPGNMTGKWDNAWTTKDIAALALCSIGDVKDIARATRESRPGRRQRVSQVILRIEAGLYVKRSKVITKLVEPERPVNPTIRRAVSFDWQGRPSLVPAPQRKVRPLFSAMLKSWDE